MRLYSRSVRAYDNRLTEPGFKGITLKKKLYDALMAEYKRRYKEDDRLKPTFTAWVSEILWKELEKK